MYNYIYIYKKHIYVKYLKIHPNSSRKCRKKKYKLTDFMYALVEKQTQLSCKRNFKKKKYLGLYLFHDEKFRTVLFFNFHLNKEDG